MTSGGQLGARVSLADLVTLVAKLKRGGIDPEFPRIVPQDPELVEAAAGQAAEDLSAYEVAHLYGLLKENKGATLEDARACIAPIWESCRGKAYNNLKDIDMDGEAVVGPGMLVKLLTLMQGLILIEQDTILAMLGWAHADFFEMPEAMTEEVLMRVFLRAPGKAPLLKQTIKSNDFMRMCHVQDLSDNTGKQGIKHAELNLFFQKTMQKMPELLTQRDERKKGLAGKKEKKGKKVKKAKKHKAHHSVSGNIKISLLFQELFHAMPTGIYKSPWHLVMTLLDTADANEAQKDEVRKVNTEPVGKADKVKDDANKASTYTASQFREEAGDAETGKEEKNNDAEQDKENEERYEALKEKEDGK